MGVSAEGASSPDQEFRAAAKVLCLPRLGHLPKSGGSGGSSTVRRACHLEMFILVYQLPSSPGPMGGSYPRLSCFSNTASLQPHLLHQRVYLPTL